MGLASAGARADPCAAPPALFHVGRLGHAADAALFDHERGRAVRPSRRRCASRRRSGSRRHRKAAAKTSPAPVGSTSTADLNAAEWYTSLARAMHVAPALTERHHQHPRATGPVVDHRSIGHVVLRDDHHVGARQHLVRVRPLDRAHQARFVPRAHPALRRDADQRARKAIDQRRVDLLVQRPEVNDRRIAPLGQDLLVGQLFGDRLDRLASACRRGTR